MYFIKFCQTWHVSWDSRLYIRNGYLLKKIKFEFSCKVIR